MRLVGAIMRIFSYLFHAGLGLFLLGISLVALINGRHNLRIDLLPWEGKALTFWLLFAALFGLASLLLAVRGKLKVLFFIWSVVVVAMLVRGYIFSGYYFGGAGALMNAVYLTLASILAAVGSWLRFRQKPAYEPY